jgi:DNA-binding NarL/FixJ family response regulator
MSCLPIKNSKFLKLLAYGKTITQIAEMHSLALTTVSTHRSRIMEKLGLSNNSELTRYAIAHQIISDIEL